MNNNHIDNLFKNGMQEPDHNFEESKWNAYKKQYLNKRKKRPFFIIFTVLTILFIFSALIYSIQKSDSSTIAKINLKEKSKIIGQFLSTSCDDESNELNNIESTDSSLSIKSNVTGPKLKNIDNIDSSKVKEKILDKFPIQKANKNQHFGLVINSIGKIASLDKQSNPETDQLNHTTDLIEKLDMKALEFKRDQIFKFQLNKTKKLNKRSLKFSICQSFALGSLKSWSQKTGLLIDIPLQKSINISSGIKYQLVVANSLNSHRGFRAKYNPFLRSFYHNSIEANKLNYLNIPLNISYIKHKSKYSIGLEYHYLFLVRGTIKNNKEGQLVEKNTWIVEDGLQQNNMYMTFAYSYQLSKKLSIRVQYDKGLNNIFSMPSTEFEKLNFFNFGVSFSL